MSFLAFGTIMEELKANIDSNKSVIELSVKKNPLLGFNKVNELAQFVGRRYNMDIRLHFPDSSRIRDVSAYGTENIGIVIDSSRKSFPIPREAIKREAEGLADFIGAKDAYMYEGKEGVRVLLETKVSPPIRPIPTPSSTLDFRSDFYKLIRNCIEDFLNYRMLARVQAMAYLD